MEPKIEQIVIYNDQNYHHCEVEDIYCDKELNVFDHEYQGYGSYEINYCPFCGVKLK